MVLFFDHRKQADLFESLLVQYDIFFERDLDERKSFFVYYAVKKIDFENVKILNDEAKSKIRKPFIPDNFLRYTVLALFFIAFGLAVAGYIAANF